MDPSSTNPQGPTPSSHAPTCLQLPPGLCLQTGKDGLSWVCPPLNAHSCNNMGALRGSLTSKPQHCHKCYLELKATDNQQIQEEFSIPSVLPKLGHELPFVKLSLSPVPRKIARQRQRVRVGTSHSTIDITLISHGFSQCVSSHFPTISHLPQSPASLSFFIKVI